MEIYLGLYNYTTLRSTSSLRSKSSLIGYSLVIIMVSFWFILWTILMLSDRGFNVFSIKLIYNTSTTTINIHHHAVATYHIKSLVSEILLTLNGLQCQQSVCFLCLKGQDSSKWWLLQLLTLKSTSTSPCQKYTVECCLIYRNNTHTKILLNWQLEIEEIVLCCPRRQLALQ